MEHIREVLIELLEALEARSKKDSELTEPPSQRQRKMQQGIIEAYGLKDEGEDLVFTFEFKATKRIKKSDYFSNRMASSTREITDVLHEVSSEFNEQMAELGMRGMKLCQQIRMEEDTKTT